MSIILNPRQLFTIPVWYTEKTGKHGESIVEIINNAQEYAAAKDPVQTTITYWKSLTWQDHNEIFSRSFRDGQANASLLKDMKIRKAFKRIKEGNEIVAVTNEIIDNLHPKIASKLIELYDQICEPNADELEEYGEGMKRFFGGKKFGPNLYPQYVYEHIIATQYGWDLDTIRKMDYYDFIVHLRLSLVREGIDKDFSLQLAGAKAPKSKLSPVKPGSTIVSKRFDPQVGNFV